MALNAGNSACSTGLSARIYTYWTGDARSGFVSPLTGAPDDAVKALCYAVARAMVDEIQANAVVTTTINAASGGGLQQVDLGAGPIDTLAAAGTHLIYGAVQ